MKLSLTRTSPGARTGFPGNLACARRPCRIHAGDSDALRGRHDLRPRRGGMRSNAWTPAGTEAMPAGPRLRTTGSLLPVKSSTKRRRIIRRSAIDSVMSDPWERGRPARNGPKARESIKRTGRPCPGGIRRSQSTPSWAKHHHGSRKPCMAKGRDARKAHASGVLRAGRPRPSGRAAPRFATGVWFRLCRVGGKAATRAIGAAAPAKA